MMKEVNFTCFDRCMHEVDAPFYLMEVNRLKIGYVVYKVKCLRCGTEFTIYTTERKTPINGLVCKQIDEPPYRVKCDWDYKDVKEAYDLMLEQSNGGHRYGVLNLAYFLRKSFSVDKASNK